MASERLSKTPVGGDDFAQMLPLDMPVSDTSGTAALLEWLRRAQRENWKWMGIEVTRRDCGLFLLDRGEVPAATDPTGPAGPGSTGR